MSHVPLTSGPTMPFSPDALGTFVPATDDKPATVIKHPDILFLLRIPTWEDRDMISLRMYAMGVREVTSDQISAMIVSEIYNVITDEAEADETARFMEGFWTRQRQYQLDLQEFNEQEALRRLDEQESGKEFAPGIPPVEPTSPKERARANLVVADVTDASQRLRDKLTDQQLYSKRFAATVARLEIAGWSGLKTEAAFDVRPALDAPALSKETINSLRSELMEIDPTGAAWDELTQECERMFDLPRSAEKNSSSPPANTSPPDGSKTRNTESATSDGSSSSSEPTADTAGSSSEPTPADTSPIITEAS